MAASPASLTDRQILTGLTRPQLAAALDSTSIATHRRAMRLNQIWNGLYIRGWRHINDITTLSKGLRAELAGQFTIERPEVAQEQRSEDGTIKWLLRLIDGREIETVYIPEEGRGALCLSSQVGCTLTCRFCHTGTQRLVRNLTVAEIVGQILVARDALGEWPKPTDNRKISNIVMMGMGEPLYNADNVRDALQIAADGDGLAISRRRITLSTAGVAPMIPVIGRETDVMLAISLHAVRDELRDELVPLNRKYPIAELLDACRAYPGLSNARRITFEYVMLRDVNDSIADARELVRLLKGIPAKINLIPFNPWPGAPYDCSSETRIRSFADVISRAGYASPVRTPRGRDIMAACGQLKSASRKIRAARATL